MGVIKEQIRSSALPQFTPIYGSSISRAKVGKVGIKVCDMKFPSASVELIF
jgi:hypothetical protein